MRLGVLAGALVALATLTLAACNEESKHDDSPNTVEIDFDHDIAKTKTVTAQPTLSRYVSIPTRHTTATTSESWKTP